MPRNRLSASKKIRKEGLLSALGGEKKKIIWGEGDRRPPQKRKKERKSDENSKKKEGGGGEKWMENGANYVGGLLGRGKGGKAQPPKYHRKKSREVFTPNGGKGKKLGKASAAMVPSGGGEGCVIMESQRGRGEEIFFRPDEKKTQRTRRAALPFRTKRSLLWRGGKGERKKKAHRNAGAVGKMKTRALRQRKKGGGRVSDAKKEGEGGERKGSPPPPKLFGGKNDRLGGGEEKKLNSSRSAEEKTMTPWF